MPKRPANKVEKNWDDVAKVKPKLPICKSCNGYGAITSPDDWPMGGFKCFSCNGTGEEGNGESD